VAIETDTAGFRSGAEDFFQQRMLDYIEKTWDRSLGPLVPELPSFATVLNELRPQIASLLQKSA